MQTCAWTCDLGHCLDRKCTRTGLYWILGLGSQPLTWPPGTAWHHFLWSPSLAATHPHCWTGCCSFLKNTMPHMHWRGFPTNFPLLTPNIHHPSSLFWVVYLTRHCWGCKQPLVQDPGGSPDYYKILPPVVPFPWWGLNTKYESYSDVCKH